MGFHEGEVERTFFCQWWEDSLSSFFPVSFFVVAFLPEYYSNSRLMT